MGLFDFLLTKKKLLTNAINDGRTDITKQLIDSGILKSFSPEEMHELLQMTAERRDQLTALAVVNACPDTDVENSIGYTLLTSAVAKGMIHVAERLMERGADVNRVSRIDASQASGMLQQVIENMQDEKRAKLLLDQLLNAGANPNYEARDRKTALQSAAKRGLIECTRALLEAGADPNIRDMVNDFAAVDLAKMEQHDEVAELLLRHGSEQPGKGVLDLAWSCIPNDKPLTDDLLLTIAKRIIQLEKTKKIWRSKSMIVLGSKFNWTEKEKSALLAQLEKLEGRRHNAIGNIFAASNL